MTGGEGEGGLGGYRCGLREGNYRICGALIGWVWVGLFGGGESKGYMGRQYARFFVARVGEVLGFVVY